MKYIYFVSYCYLTKDNITGFGNVTHTRKGKIISHEDLISVADSLLKIHPEWKNVVILNFILMSTVREKPVKENDRIVP